MKIEDVKLYEKNAKIHPNKQLGLIAASINAFGCKQPVVLTSTGDVIVGHGRFIAMTSLLGWTDLQERSSTKKGEKIIPYVIADDLTEEEVNAYRLADNKLNESAWDMKLVVTELKDLSEPMVDLTGFSRDLVLESAEKDDDTPDVPMEARSKVGDIFQLGLHRVMCGDSTKREDVERLMDGNLSDMVFTDPPWNVAIGGDNKPKHRQREGLINDDLGKNFPAFLNASGHTIADFNKGDAYVVMGCEEWPTIDKALRDAGLHWSATIIWAKDIFVLGRSKYHSQYEPIWYGWKGVSSFVADRKQSDLWQFKRPKRSESHPTMKPVELVLHAIKNSSTGGGVVLDPFLGSGTTLIAAHKAERVCYGMELDPKYVDVCIQRYVDFTEDPNVLRNGIVETWTKQ